MIITTKDKLAKRAILLKKSWLVCCAWLSYTPQNDLLEIPDFKAFEREL